MSDVAVSRPTGSDVIEAVITKGDLSKLTPSEKTQYYAEVCRSVGLNPFTRPFEYISLSGKLTLYARREATDQLRRLNGISLEVVSRQVNGDILTVHVRAKDKTGRSDEDFGSVSIAGLRGEALANAQMKALTKGKRRVTLSISGLGFLDESEIEDIPRYERAAPQDTRAALDSFAGSIRPPDVSLPHAAVQDEEEVDLQRLEIAIRAVASRGTESLRRHMRTLSKTERELLGPLVGSRDQPGDLLVLAMRSDEERQTAPSAQEDAGIYDLETGEVVAREAAPRPRDEAWWDRDVLTVAAQNPREFQQLMHARVREARSVEEVELMRASNPLIDELDRSSKEDVLAALADRERELRER